MEMGFLFEIECLWLLPHPFGTYRAILESLASRVMPRLEDFRPKVQWLSSDATELETNGPMFQLRSHARRAPYCCSRQVVYKARSAPPRAILTNRHVISHPHAVHAVRHCPNPIPLRDLEVRSLPSSPSPPAPPVRPSCIYRPLVTFASFWI